MSPEGAGISHTPVSEGDFTLSSSHQEADRPCGHRNREGLGSHSTGSPGCSVALSSLPDKTEREPD